MILYVYFYCALVRYISHIHAVGPLRKYTANISACALIYSSLDCQIHRTTSKDLHNNLVLQSVVSVTHMAPLTGLRQSEAIIIIA